MDKKKFFKGVKRTLVYGSYVFTIVAGIAAIVAFFYPNTVGNALQAFIESNEEIAETSREIADNTADAKREVSNDPVIQLSNRGYQFNFSDFARSIQNHDLTTVQLYCSSAPPNWVSDKYFPFGVNWSNDMLGLLSRCPAIDRDTMCEIDPSRARFRMVSRDGEDKDRFIKFCGRGTERRINQAAAQYQNAEDAQYIQACQAAAERVRGIIQRIKNRDPNDRHYMKVQSGREIANFQRYGSCYLEGCASLLTVELDGKWRKIERCRDLGVDLQEIATKAIQ